MHWRDILTIGLNHHLLYADRSADPEAHCESLLRVLADERLEAVDLWIPDEPGIAEREIQACLRGGKLIVYNVGSRQGKPSPIPASLDEDEQAYAIAFYLDELSRANAVNAAKVVTNSGPDNPERRGDALQALQVFYREVCAAVPASTMVLIEPTDRDLSKRKLLGPSGETAAFCRDLRADGVPNLASMVDMGHVPLLGETLDQAFADSGPFVEHVHLGNCVLQDRSHPMFGDKHVPWGTPGGEYGVEGIAEFFRAAFACGYLAEGKRPTVSFEMRPHPDLGPERSLDRFFAELEEGWQLYLEGK
jgi:sugar phosphate isomerase/epimerase